MSYVNTSTASSFRIWNSSTGIPSPPLALFVVMLSKACREPAYCILSAYCILHIECSTFHSIIFQVNSSTGILSLPGAGAPPMAKVMRKEARRTQRRDRASGVPLEILEHLPPNQSLPTFGFVLSPTPLTLRGLSPTTSL